MTRPLVLLSLVGGCALGPLLTAHRSHPDLDGQLFAPGAQQPIAVFRDAWGVPHIRAGSERDAVFALGFAQAQDRLFQADLTRHLATGRLADWFGQDTVELDVFMASLGLRKRAVALVAALPPEPRAILEAFAAGMNAGAASLEALPVEYRLIGAEYEGWTAADCLMPLAMMAVTLNENLSPELASLELTRVIDRDAAQALLVPDGIGPAVDAGWDTLAKLDLPAFTPAFRAFAATLGSGDPAASNAWAVGGGSTVSGKPILASDPHLHQTVPSLWYVAELQGGPVHVAGLMLPGTPLVAIGHNETLAWGFTNLMADVVDLVVLERAGADGYVLEGRTLPLRTETVKIAVRGGASVERAVSWTEVGPVVSELDGTHLVALRWTLLEHADHSIELFHALQRAPDVATALEAPARHATVLGLNFVVADTGGDFAWQAIGTVPRRRTHTGRIPYLGSAAGTGWDGVIAPLPGERRADRGFVVSANDRPDDDGADAISTRFAPSWRRDRITEVLGEGTAHTPDGQRQLQLDVLDRHALAGREALLTGHEPRSEEARRCQQWIADWDGRATVDSVGASVWAMFQHELLRVALVDDLGERGLHAYRFLANMERSVVLGDIDRFLPDRAAGIDEALEAACARLEDELGGRDTRWTWGRLHPLTLRHPFAARSALLRGWNQPKVAYPGAVSTVNVGAYSLEPSDPEVIWMASARLVVPLDDPGAATLGFPGGESGQPGQRFYRTHFRSWMADEPVPLLFDDADIHELATDAIVLRPPEAP